jgi:ABC-type glutathione transport system ATPase component
VTPLAIGDLLPILESASRQKKGVITQVLSPYIRSFEARLNALEELREALNTFSEIFARFYNYKTLEFNLRTGISINLQHSTDKIAPEVLSSGEKQLLLLFCNVLLARSRPSVFIIDEPELSLNIKWQRELISSLLSCVRGCDVQFLFATHSLEMISLHKASAIKLENAE